jgi:hypothetical protein
MTASFLSTGWQEVRESCKVGTSCGTLRRKVLDAGVRLEHMVVVRETGPDVTDHYPREIITVG